LTPDNPLILSKAQAILSKAQAILSNLLTSGHLPILANPVILASNLPILGNLSILTRAQASWLILSSKLLTPANLSILDNSLSILSNHLLTLSNNQSNPANLLTPDSLPTLANPLILSKAQASPHQRRSFPHPWTTLSPRH
jgi:hypothetical protein